MSGKNNKLRFELRDIARTEDWQIIHGTLMTILMIFFMVLFASSYVEREVDYEKMIGSIQEGFGGTINMERVDKARYKEKERKVAEKLSADDGLKQFTRIETDRERIKIIFPDPVIFSPGLADLKLETLWLLGGIAEHLKLIPENKIIIEGHTDNIPIPPGGKFSSNWELSLNRSLSIVHYLTEVEGMDAKRFVPVGYGEFGPLFPNDTPENRAQNRRIEISIIKKE